MAIVKCPKCDGLIYQQKNKLVCSNGCEVDKKTYDLYRKAYKEDAMSLLRTGGVYIDKSTGKSYTKK